MPVKHWDPARFNLGIDEFDPDSLNVNVFTRGLAFHF